MITERIEEIIKKFKSFEQWEDRYRQLISYGKKITVLADDKKSDDLIVPGCQSRVWLYHEYKDGKILFSADSDAAIAKGIIGVLVYVYSDSTPQEIIDHGPEFLKEIGITDHLSMNRRNGLANMCRMIQAYAVKNV